MTEMDVFLAFFRSSRERTLGTLGKIEAEAQPVAVLGWRPGPGRAHIGWQLLHIAATEELFATERLVPGSRAAWPELIARFKGGSTPDEQIPSPGQIRETLTAARDHLEATLKSLTPTQLDEVPSPIAERGWTFRTVLQVLGWHEAHHQGQAHLTYNLWKAAQPQAAR